jgi:serine/threonine-protein kinase
MVVAVLVVVGVAIANNQNSTPSSAPQTTFPTGPTGASTYTSTYSAPPTSTYTPTVDPVTAAQQQLQAFLNEDRATVAQLAERWVPQLSSKHAAEPWTYDREDGVTYDLPAILREFTTLRSQYGAVLAWSGDWTVYDQPDYWVTVVPTYYTNARGALGWCTSHNLDPDHCIAQVISSTQGRSGTHASN